MLNKTIKIATRKSPLALWQANDVARKLQKNHQGLSVELVEISTKGDKVLDAPLAKIGGKGLFVKELEQALLDGRADIAVHSMKDVPMELPSGLILSSICERENPQDAFVSNNYNSIKELPKGAIVGTSSLRRKAQLLAKRPDLIIKDLRGNVGTRLQKLDDGHYDAIILAAAGLIRLEQKERIKDYIETSQILPAVGQGAVGIECREKDQRVLDLISVLHHSKTAKRVEAERAMNNRLSGGCQVPVAGHATLEGNKILLKGFVGSINGQKRINTQHVDLIENANELGVLVAEEMISKGAMEILNQIENEQ